MGRSGLVLAMALVLGGCRASLDGAPGHGPAAESDSPLAVLRPAAAHAHAAEGHAHASPRGTPFVHAFHTEPAFLARHLLLHVEREGDAHGIEAEVEWPLTQRLGLLAEVPYAWTHDEGGLGDVALGVRVLLCERDRFLVAGQAVFELPTAKAGLGADEIVAAPALLAWVDLGRWVTAQGSLGMSYGSAVGGTELSWGAVLAKSFPLRTLLRSPGAGHDHGAHGHGTHSFLSFLLETRGAAVLSGPDEGATSRELLLGVSLPLASEVDVRAGWTLLWEDDEPAASGWVAGVVLEL